MNVPTFGSGYSKKQSHCDCFGYWAKGLKEVNAMNLIEAFGNKPGFISLHFPICLVFDRKNPP